MANGNESEGVVTNGIGGPMPKSMWEAAYRIAFAFGPITIICGGLVYYMTTIIDGQNKKIDATQLFIESTLFDVCRQSQKLMSESATQQKANTDALNGNTAVLTDLKNRLEAREL